MISMDLQGVTWVGNLYEKFEAMCLEVEENMYQDTIKYVENQVQTVGETVKKFYSEVLQELSPIDSVKTATDDATVKPAHLDNAATDKKPEARISCEILMGDAKQSTLSAIDKKAEARISYEILMVDAKQSTLSDKTRLVAEENCSEMSTVEGIDCDDAWKTGKDIVRDLRTASNNEMTASQSNLISLPSLGGTKQCDSEEKLICDEMSGNIGAEMRLSFSGDLSEATLRGCFPQISEEMLKSLPGDEDWDASDIEKEKVNPLDDSEVVETCVMVDATKSCFVSQKDAIARRKSYKKKLREAFGMRRKSGRMLEYEQLAMLYGETDTASNLAQKLVMGSGREELMGQDSCESEWEVL